MTPPPNHISITIPSTSATALPPSSLPTPPQSDHSSRQISRRSSAAVLASFIAAPLILSLRTPPPASAFSLGISGPKDWLKEQKKKSSRFLLAPIDASRSTLLSAYLLLTKGETEFQENDIEEIKKLITSAARDCVVQERNALVAFQAKTGVEVCTFRLLVKNAASLLDDTDPVKLEAEAKLDQLLTSLASLSDVTSQISIKVATDRQKVSDALNIALYYLNDFEQGIKNCLLIG